MSVDNDLNKIAQRLVLHLAVAMIALNFIFPIGLWIYALLEHKAYWRMFSGHDNFVTWFSSLQLVMIGIVAYVNGLLRKPQIGGESFPTRVRRWIWPIFALGFIFLGVDEQFELHEALRDHVLRPGGLFTGLSFVGAGDIGLYAVFIVGVVFSVFLYQELRADRSALVLFASALALSLAVVVIDGLPSEASHGWAWRNFWNYTFEEIGECWAQLLFLLSFLALLRTRLKIGYESPTPR